LPGWFGALIYCHNGDFTNVAGLVPKLILTPCRNHLVVVSAPLQGLLVYLTRNSGCIEQRLTGRVGREPVVDTLPNILGDDGGVVGVDMDIVDDLPRLHVVTMSSVQQRKGYVEEGHYLLVHLHLDC